MAVPTFRFDPVEMPPEAIALRHEVRAFIKRASAPDGLHPRRVQSRLQPRDGQARLDRHDLAEAIWRARAQFVRTLRGDRGNAGRRRALVRALHRRPAKRPEPAALRHRGTEAVLPAENRRGRTDLLHRHERAELRFRPRRHPHPRGEGGWRLQDQRQQAVDVQRASRRLRHPVLQDGAGGPGRPRSSRRRNAIPAAAEIARHRHPPGAQPAGRAPLQRNIPD